MSGQPPGRTQYEVFRAAVPDYVCNVPAGPWEELPPTIQAGFAALAAQEQQPAPRLAVVQEALAVAFGTLQMVALGTDDAVGAQARKAVALVKEILSGDVAVPAAKPAPELAAARDASDLEVAAIITERNQLRAALERLASEDWLGTQGYDGDELQRRVEFARDKLAAIRPELTESAEP